MRQLVLSITLLPVSYIRYGLKRTKLPTVLCSVYINHFCEALPTVFHLSCEFSRNLAAHLSWNKSILCYCFSSQFSFVH
ncbi:uncharacterized protein DEA37_0006788 [Paragonimus westermani]|uniref:Uncharacterized protein n=1 Tax=Paragonimus westermani TaxID=34504 RepID=A0A5J4NN14_9TREM|nr:uncharacterized protein DEA37_0006788 [Paragonimus westermani]